MLDRELVDDQFDTFVKDVDAHDIKSSPSNCNSLVENSEANQPDLSSKKLIGKNCTNLFSAIENKNWPDVTVFLDTSKWPETQLSPDLPPLKQATTAVSGVDKETELEWNYLPLHLAVLRGAPIDIVRRLVKLAPESTTVPDHDGNLALHLAMLMNSRYEVQECILGVYPSAVSIENTAGKTPIECAVMATNERAANRGKIISAFVKHGASPPRILKLGEIAMFTDYDKSCSPLYNMILKKEWSSVDHFLAKGTWSETNWVEQIFDSLLSKNQQVTVDPKEQVMTLITKRKENGNLMWAQLPIHAAITLGAPLSVIKKLVDLCPRSLAFPDKNGMLPIHLALHFNAKDGVIASLLEKLPEALQVRDTKHRSALDMALQGENAFRGKVIQAFMTKNQRE